MSMANKDFLTLVDEQVSLVETFANAQTLLYNSISNVTVNPSNGHSSSGFRNPSLDRATNIKITRALEQLHTSRMKVRSNFVRLQNHPSFSLRYSKHLGLTKRVLETISENPSWHANGLPSEGDATKGIQTNTVAIAALKASVARIREENDGSA